MKMKPLFGCVAACAAALVAQAPVTQEAKPTPAAESRAVREAPKPGKVKAGDKLPSFLATTWDVATETPKSSEWDSLKVQNVTVIVVQGVKCPATKSYEDRLRELETTYRKKGVDFVYLYPNRTETDELKQTYHRTQKLAGPMVLDAKGVLTRALGSDHTSDIYVVKKDGVVAYRGGLDDNKRAAKVKTKFAVDALEAVLAGKEPAVKYTDAPG